MSKLIHASPHHKDNPQESSARHPCGAMRLDTTAFTASPSHEDGVTYEACRYAVQEERARKR